MKTFPRSSYQKSRPESRPERLQRHLTAVRQRIFDMTDAKADQAGDVITAIKRQLEPVWSARAASNAESRSNAFLRTYA